MNELEVRWASNAEHDLIAITGYIASTDPVSALAIFHRIRDCARSLGSQASRGRLVPELRDAGAQYRELIARPWRVVYRTEPERVFIVAVLDSRRDLQTLLLERLIRS
jgi:toxin ParE1/3/4